MSAMKEEVYGEAIIDVVNPQTLVSDPAIIKACESPKVSSFPSNELSVPFLHIGHIRPRRAAASTQFPILFLPRLHDDKTHQNSHLGALF